MAPKLPGQAALSPDAPLQHSHLAATPPLQCASLSRYKASEHVGQVMMDKKLDW